MSKGRWYPSTTTLANGEVLVMSGSDQTAAIVRVPEVWKTNSGGGYRFLNGASKLLPLYPRAFLAPNGKVFYAGEMQRTFYLNTKNNGLWTVVADRRVAGRDYGSAVMYSPGKVIYIGGGNPPTNTAEVIDLNQAPPSWRLTSPMAFARRQMNATLLPTGEILVTGGTSAQGFTNPAGAVHAAEVWNPTTETWTTLESNSVTRVYHGTTLLLPDGRILHTGSGDQPGIPDELNAEIFSPPYLFQGPRPSISSMPASVSYGQSFTVTTPDAANIARVTLIRLPSVTDAFDMNQRFVEATFSELAGDLSVQAPTSPNLAPPGHYMLFLIDTTGVPSIARIFQII